MNIHFRSPNGVLGVKYNLLKYFLGIGRLDDKERSAIETEIRKDRRWFFLDSAADESPIEWDTEAELRRLEQRIGVTVAKDSRHSSDRAPVSRLTRRGFRTRSRWHQLAIQGGVVGALIMVVIAGVLMWDSGPAHQTARQYTADKGKRVHITLDDGTSVVLNANSRLSIDSDFGDRMRAVRLEGEAYFDVHSDASLPFVIDAGEAVVRVLGTSFGIRSYASENDVRVVVRDGRVAFRAADAPGNEVLLERSDAGYLVGGRELSVLRDVDVASLLGWVEGRLVFVDQPFVEVARELERWYDVEIEIHDDVLRTLPLTATFEGQAFFHVIDVISRTLGFDYQIDERVISITPR